MINFPPSLPSQAAACSARTPRKESPRNAAAPQPHHDALEALPQARPPARPALDAGAGRSHADLPRELICRIAESLPPCDARHYAQADRATNGALSALRILRQSQRDHQLHLMAQARLTRTPEALLAVVQQILAQDGRLHPEPLEVAGHQLGKVAGLKPGETAAAVFHAVWQAIVALPVHLRSKPLFAIARHVAALPENERLAALKDASAQIRQLPMDAPRHRTTHEWAHLLPKLPAQDAAAGLQHLLDEARPFSPAQRRDLVRLLQRIEARMPLSPQEHEEAHAAMAALLAAPPGDGALTPPSAAWTAAPRPAGVTPDAMLSIPAGFGTE